MGPAYAVTATAPRVRAADTAVHLRSLVLGGALMAGIAAGLLATDAAVASHAASEAGADLTRLLRAMAILKAMMASAAAAATVWRARAPMGPAQCCAFALALAAMGAGPGLIWNMAHVPLGALLLHGGLIATLLLLWRDPAVGARLAAILAARRLRLAAL